MKYVLPVLLPASLMLFSSIASAELYKWVDAQGIVHYTDRLPAEGVRQENLPSRLKSLANRKTQQPADETESIYADFSITLPQPNEIIRTTDATVNIMVQIDPPLTEPHFLQIYLDGLEVGEKTKSTALTLQQMKKGTHRLQARIVDSNGEQVMKTEEITFQYREPSDLSKVAPNLVSKPAN